MVNAEFQGIMDGKNGEQNLTMSLNQYYTLGNTGLRVSRLALGTMTFGTEWGWGADRSNAAKLFNTYVDAGGNFLFCSGSIY